MSKQSNAPTNKKMYLDKYFGGTMPLEKFPSIRKDSLLQLYEKIGRQTADIKHKEKKIEELEKELKELVQKHEGEWMNDHD